jgi:hypothetical protein
MSSLWRSLRQPDREIYLLTALILLIVSLVYTQLYREWLHINSSPHGDGYYSWIFARSLAYDFDINLANDYALCGNPGSAGIVKATGHYGDPFYIGPALLWAPILFVLRHVVSLGDADVAVLSACKGRLTELTGAAAAGLGAVTCALTFLSATRFASRGASFWAALAVAFCTTLVCYSTTLWFYSHASAAFAVALVLWLALRARERPRSVARWLLVGAASGCAGLMRPPEALWALVPVAFSLSGNGGFGWRWDLFGKWLRALLPKVSCVALGFLSTYVIQLLVYKYIYGTWWLVTQGKLFMQPWHSHPFLMLFSPISGFYSWTPIAWLATLGMVLLVASSRRSLVLPVLVVTIAEIWVSAAALPWAGGATFGQRFLTSLAPVIGITVAAALERTIAFLGRGRRAQHAAAAALLVLGGATTIGMVETGTLRYGDGFETSLDRSRKLVGEPSTLPANLVFSARYGARAPDFTVVANNGMFNHSYRTGTLVGDDTIHFATPRPAVLHLAGTFDDGGLHVDPLSSARFLATLYWPWVTKIRLAYHTDWPGTVQIRTCGFVVCREAARIDIDSVGDAVAIVDVPEGTFDSGINEVRIESTGAVTLLDWTWIDGVQRDPGILDL